MSEKMTVLIVEPGKAPYAKEIEAGLSSLQHEIGGSIEAIYPFRAPVSLICGEEGKVKGKEPNRVMWDERGRIYDMICGTFLVVGLGEENFCSLSGELMQTFSRIYEAPDRIVRCETGFYRIVPSTKMEHV